MDSRYWKYQSSARARYLAIDLPPTPSSGVGGNIPGGYATHPGMDRAGRRDFRIRVAEARSGVGAVALHHNKEQRGFL